MHAGSTDVPLATAFALHVSLSEAFLPAAFSRAASHLLGPASGSALRTAVAQFSARHSHTGASPGHTPALANARPYLPSTLATQVPMPDASPVFVALE